MKKFVVTSPKYKEHKFLGILTMEEVNHPVKLYRVLKETSVDGSFSYRSHNDFEGVFDTTEEAASYLAQLLQQEADRLREEEDSAKKEAYEKASWVEAAAALYLKKAQQNKA